MDVALDLWRPEEHRELVHALAEATRARRPAALVTAINPVDDLPAGAKAAFLLKGRGPKLTPSFAARPSHGANLQRLPFLPALRNCFLFLRKAKWLRMPSPVDKTGRGFLSMSSPGCKR